MSLVKRNSDNLFPSFFDNFLSKDWMDWNNFNYSNTNTTLPSVNISESSSEFVIELAAPGMHKNDFKINLENNQLNISSEKKEEKESKKEKYTRKEFSYQSFQRSFQLPVELVDANKISAEYKEGILRLLLPKKEEAKPQPAKAITIN
ncbi:Hsp20/alpha crystallin family protein [Labilibaculum sp.]|uniref:Hsp20/alpha crystallin family protein n=1 Tax=Labilibaculum sp. TaxID=2060723 RepID=UPI003567B79C